MTLSQTTTCADAMLGVLAEVMEEHDDALMIGSAWIGAVRDRDPLWTGFVERYGRRIHYPPISELAVAGVGVGAAIAGFRPLVNLGMASYALQSWPQIVGEAAQIRYLSNGKASVPLVLHVFGGGRAGAAAQHTQYIEGMLWNVPGLEIVMPSSPRDVAGLLRASFESDDPTLFVNDLDLLDVVGPAPGPGLRIPLGRAEIKRDGSDVTVVALGRMVHEALSAADELAGADGVSVEVLDPRSLRPLDDVTLVESVARTGRLVVAEPGQRTAGVGSEIVARAAEALGPALRVARRVALPDVPMPCSPALKQAVTPTAATLASAVREALADR